MDRRSFIRRAALASGGLAFGPRIAGAFDGTTTGSLGAAMTGARATRAIAGPSILDGPASEAAIDTIVVLMMENRSVDHYLGWLATDEAYLERGRSRYGDGFGIDADNSQSFVDATTGLPVATYHFPSNANGMNPYRGCDREDPGHGWNAGRAQRDGGFLASGSGNDDFALAYYDAEDIPVYAHLARRFTTFDRSHCSVLGPTYPNRYYMHSAQAGGEKGNRIPAQEGGYDWPTIWDRLLPAGVDAAYYFVDLPAILLWGPRMLPFVRHIEDFFAQAATGTLPRVVFLDPGFTTGMRTDDHPHADIRAGQRFVFDVVQAMVNSPQWRRSALFVTYDEWGGFFDHVPPPILPDDRASADDAENFGQAGFRIPTFMVSPFARPGFVDHRLYDHTSILRFIEWRFLGAPAEGPAGEGWYLTARDRNAANIAASLAPEVVDDVVYLEALPQIPVASAPCEGKETEGTGFGIAEPPHPLSEMLDSGYLERVGFVPDLRPYPISW